MTSMITTTMISNHQRDQWFGETLAGDGRHFRWEYLNGELLNCEAVDGQGIRWPLQNAPAELIVAVVREVRRRAH